MQNSLELLEEKFRRVEQATERRALYEPELSLAGPSDPTLDPRKHPKKPAVSISQFGKQEGDGEDGIRSPVPSPLSAAASKSTFYHALANPRSIESFVSEKSEQEMQGEHADEQHEILVERIAGRQTLPSALLPRRLTRAQSQIDYRAINSGMVIDVSVETTMESCHIQALNVQTSTAYATRPSRSRAATVGVLTSQGSLVERTKGFARKLRRKSRA